MANPDKKSRPRELTTVAIARRERRERQLKEAEERRLKKKAEGKAKKKAAKNK
jgi:hypothetical protein